MVTRRGSGGVGIQRVCRVDTLDLMEKTAPDPAKLLADWEEWEKGVTPPGRVMSNLKTGGLRDLLRSLAEAAS